MSAKYLDLTGLSHFLSKVKAIIPSKTSDLTNDSNFVVDASYVHTDNNLTNTLLTKLNGIAEGAQVNVIESIKVNNVAQTVTSKAVNITVPTKTSDITNDSNFVVDASYVHTDNNFTTTLKNKLNGIATGAQVNTIETVKVNGTALTPDANKAVDITVPTNNNQLTNGAGYQTASDVNTAIDAKLSSTYKPKGTCTFANKPALSADHEGEVWNISDAFTTTSDFVEGSGKEYPAGTNIVVVNNGTSQSPIWKYDALAGFIDLSSYYSSSQVDTLLNGKQNTLTQGTNISINGDTISTPAQVNVIETIKVNGTAQTVTNKAVDISVPEMVAITTAEINALFAS